MALSPVTAGFKRKSFGCRLPPSKRIHLLNTSAPQRAYYLSLDDEEPVLLEHERQRRFLMPIRRRSVVRVRVPRRESIAGLIDDASKLAGGVLEQAPSADATARARCFDYLMGAIDEAWARYCETTSCAEDKMYSSMSVDFPATPVSATNSDYESDYKTDVTDLTDYESDYEYTNKKKASAQPESVKIQNLKDRLVKAKKYLEDLVELNNVDDCIAFWARWDLIKYATIEVFEDDDDDDLIEDTIEELERGRSF